MPRESALQRAARAWQTSIAAHETEQQRLLLRRWRSVERDIHRRIQTVERRLAAAAARGQSPGVTLLYERGRLAELRDQVERALADFGDTWVRRVTVDRQAAAREAIEWSERFLRDQLGPDVTLQRLPTDVVMQAVSFQAPGGPLDQLMREAGTRAGHAIAEGLTTGLTSGQNPNVIARRIREHVVPTYRRRAITIARTETMRAVRAATLQRYKTVADLLQGWVWWASTDRTTCATCWAMHGTEHPLSEDMDSHPACFPAGTMVVPSGRLEAATSRPYRGELVTIRTASGDLLTGTPNHPVATSRGWVPLDLIKPGDQVFHRPQGQRRGTASRHPDDQHAPTLIEEVAESLRGAGEVSSTRVPSAPEHFHGDGSHGNVDVVAAAGLLRGRSDPQRPQFLLDENFVVRDPGPIAFPRLRRTDPLFLAGHAPSGGLVRRSGERLVFLGGAPGRHDRVLAVASEANSSVHQHAPDDHSGHPDGSSYSDLRLAGFVQAHDAFNVDGGPSLHGGFLASERIPLGLCAQHAASYELAFEHAVTEPWRGLADGLSPLPADVTLDRVVNVDRSFGSLHVYNLQTSDGCYLANNIVVHNCRCVMLPRAEGLGVDLGPTGPDLFAARPADVQLAVLGPKRHGLYRSGELTLPDMVQEHWSPRWGLTRNTASIQASRRAASLRRATNPGRGKQSA